MSYLATVLAEYEQELARIADDLDDDWVDGRQMSGRVGAISRRLAVEVERLRATSPAEPSVIAPVAGGSCGGGFHAQLVTTGKAQDNA